MPVDKPQSRSNATAWVSQKASISFGRRKQRVDALVSGQAPGIALRQGQFVDMERDGDKPNLDVRQGWQPIVLSSGASCGPIMSDFDQASEYAITVSGFCDWPTAPKEVPPPIYAKIMRLWFTAAGHTLTPEQEAQLAEMESVPAAPVPEEDARG